MKNINRLFILLAFGLLTTLGSNTVLAADEPFEKYEHIVDYAFMKDHATVPMRDDVVVVDSRPDRKYDSGYISPALNIPDRQFDTMTALLPEDKSTLLIFYCGGVKCPLLSRFGFGIHT